MLGMEVALPNGNILPMHILVDTGAQANLVRRELILKELLGGCRKSCEINSSQ